MHSIERALITAAERLGIQVPRARLQQAKKMNDLTREAVSCNAGLGRPSDSCWRCTIRTRSKTDPNLGNNATLYRRAKTTSWSGS